MSSLQQALDNAATVLKLEKLNKKSKQSSQEERGAFETSFFQGLDISELVAAPAKPLSNGDSDSTAVFHNNRESASEILLQTKKEERRKRQIQEVEETRMEEALKRRLNSLKQNSKHKSKERKQPSFDIGDALFRMHDTDETATSMLSQKANIRKGRISGGMNRRWHSAPKRKNHKTKKMPITKKSRTSKF